ncbi:MAG: NADH-quinone oxidoreductase subunit C [Deltaproteobacteria bacterium]|nr:NADH-quinone oxidoreductase subunit C [Deltaproteobacteria bacterium]
MAQETTNFKQDILFHEFNATETDYNQRGYHLEVALEVNQVRKFAQKAYDQGFFLVFVTGFHVLPEETEEGTTSGLNGVYQFARFDRLYRIKGQVSVPEDMSLPSICDIYQGADWHERETRDLYGINFEGHPNIKPILLSDEDKDFHPLLKEEKKLKSLEKVSWPPEALESVDADTDAKASSTDSIDSQPIKK